MLLQDMQEYQVEEVCTLIAAAMGEVEARHARQSFVFHFKCKALGLSDGREYFVSCLDERLVAITGLHHYEWGPAENVWLAWFAVRPDYQRQGIGRCLLNELERLAKVKGYQKLFIETYDHPAFAKARQFYAACGFQQVGDIQQYLPDGSGMVVYLKKLGREGKQDCKF